MASKDYSDNEAVRSREYRTWYQHNPCLFFSRKKRQLRGERYSIITALRVGQRFEYRVLLHTRYIIGSRLTP